MKKVLFGYIMNGKAGGIDKYMLNFFEHFSPGFPFRRERYVRLSVRTAAAKQRFAISSAALFRLFTAERLKGRLKYSEKAQKKSAKKKRPKE